VRVWARDDIEDKTFVVVCSLLVDTFVRKVFRGDFVVVDRSPVPEAIRGLERTGIVFREVATRASATKSVLHSKTFIENKF